MEHSVIINAAEAVLRVILGWRFLVSGLSNVRRWPNPVNTASLIFPKYSRLLGLLATVLMVAGGIGVAAGFQTSISSAMLIVFLIPTFSLHSYWLKVLPTWAPAIKGAIGDDQAREYFRTFERQSFHAHETGIRDNVVLLAAAAYFCVRGSGPYGLDILMPGWFSSLF